jgi:thiamine kinase-like enzyme
MDYIDGSEITQKSLPAEQLEGVLEELKGYIAQMRALNPTRPGRVEAADGSGIFDVRLRGDPYPALESIERFHELLGHAFVLAADRHRRAWPQFLEMGNRRYCTKFTHSDIAPRNILVKNGKIAAIIDWETAGWYPEYWEYIRWEASNYRSSRRWLDVRDEILERYPDEFRVDNYLEGIFTRL